MIDDDPTTIDEVPANVVPLTTTTRKISGRQRLHNGVCPLHGTAANGEPCSKFASLPGGGKGVKQPNPYLRVVVLVRALIKPLVILAILFGGFTVAKNQVSDGIFSSIVPTGIVGTPNGEASPGPNSNNPSSGVRPDCLQPGNPCRLVLPSESVK